MPLLAVLGLIGLSGCLIYAVTGNVAVLLIQFILAIFGHWSAQPSRVKFFYDGSGWFLLLFSNLAPLLFFKLSNANIPDSQISTVWGISIFTFNAIAQLVSVRNRNDRQEIPNLTTHLLNFFYFPKYFVGPLMGYFDFSSASAQLKFKPLPDQSTLRLLLLGSLKVMVFSRELEGLLGGLPKNDLDFASLILVSFLGLFQIYLEFSGFNDLILGISRFFNIELPSNFNCPFSSKNPVDFFQRWHITLYNFTNEYIFKFLALKTRSLYFSAFFAFFLLGVWHGLNHRFVLMGLVNGIYVTSFIILRDYRVLDLTSSQYIRWLGRALNLTLIAIMFLLFRVEDLSEFFSLLRVKGVIDWALTKDTLVVWFLYFSFCIFSIAREEVLYSSGANLPKPLFSRWVLVTAFLGLMGVFFGNLSNSAIPTFMYFRF